MQPHELEPWGPVEMRLDSGAAYIDVLPDASGQFVVQPASGERDGLSWTTTGLVDLQVNGFAGVDFNDEGVTAEQLDHALSAMLATGVTTCLPTMITASVERLKSRFEALDRAVSQSRLGPLMVPGYHLEGPYLNPADGYAGCHPADAMGPADWSLIEGLDRTLSRPVLLVTVAPERPGVVDLIGQAARAGKVVALGHTNLDAASMQAAVDAGATMSTHLGNGLPAVLPKLDNPFIRQLAEDRLTASIIADGIHVPIAALKVMLRAKGLNRAVLVTDAVSAAAAKPGRHSFAGETVELSNDGTVRQPGSRYLAGSSLRMDQAVRNVVGWELAGFRDAIRLASANPASFLADPMRRHGIAPIFGAVKWSERMEVDEAIVGTVRYRRS